MKLNTRGIVKSSLCKVKRDAGINVSVPDTQEFKRTRITRRACEMLKRGTSLDSVETFIEDEMSRLVFVSETTKNLQKKEVMI